MKKVVLIIAAVFSLTACKQQKDNKKNETSVVSENSYQLDAETSIVNWTGYKFTEKKGVKGTFKSATITNNLKALSIEKALVGSQISIPVKSIYSQNEIRDNKLKTLFFGMMENTELLSAKIENVSGNKGTMALTMNNETHSLPFVLKQQGNTAYLSASIDLHTWHADKALASIHKACELLHTGTDGVSKTWNTVDVEAILNFKH